MGILEEVKAVQAKEDNLQELKSLDSKIEKVKGQCEYYYYYHTPKCTRVLYGNDWLIKHKDGRLEVMSDDEFRRN